MCKKIRNTKFQMYKQTCLFDCRYVWVCTHTHTHTAVMRTFTFELAKHAQFFTNGPLHIHAYVHAYVSCVFLYIFAHMTSHIFVCVCTYIYTVQTHAYIHITANEIIWKCWIFHGAVRRPASPPLVCIYIGDNHINRFSWKTNKKRAHFQKIQVGEVMSQCYMYPDARQPNILSHFTLQRCTQLVPMEMEK